MAPEALGELELQILLAVIRLGNRVRTAHIVLALEEHGGREVAPAAVYIALRRLEKRGFIRSRLQQARPGEGGRGQRTFEVTPAALHKLRELRRTLEGLWAGLDPVFENE